MHQAWQRAGWVVKQMIDISIIDAPHSTDIAFKPVGGQPCALFDFFKQRELEAAREITRLSVEIECTETLLKQALSEVERVSPGTLDTVEINKATPFDPALLAHVIERCPGIRMIACVGHSRSVKLPSKCIRLVDLPAISRLLAGWNGITSITGHARLQRCKESRYERVAGCRL